MTDRNPARLRELNQVRRQLPNNPFDDTPIDRAKTLGLVGEARTIVEDDGCSWCCGLPWRRAKPNCMGCGEPYREERVEREIPGPQSAMFRIQEV